MASSIILLAVCSVLSYKRDVEEGVVLKHSCADSFGEFFDLLFDVSKEYIGAPASNEHDGIDWFSY